jgi:hypothetical protein
LTQFVPDLGMQRKVKFTIETKEEHTSFSYLEIFITTCFILGFLGSYIEHIVEYNKLFITKKISFSESFKIFYFLTQ